jgi:hypothetical protein
MTLYHHDGRTYADAASAAAKHARDKIGSMIEKGKGRAMEVLHQINTDVPADYVAAGPQLTWNVQDDDLRLGLGNHDLGVHAHALGQACGKVNLPIRYARDLNGISDWGQELLAHNLNELYRRNEKRHLVRAVHGEARGILSDKYKRLDSRPIVEAFAQEVAQYGAVPIEGYALDTKIALKALMPTVFEPVENEIMAIGMVLQNSDAPGWASPRQHRVQPGHDRPRDRCRHQRHARHRPFEPCRRQDRESHDGRPRCARSQGQRHCRREVPQGALQQDRSAGHH